jgi:large conductance mechanosensitive channel
MRWLEEFKTFIQRGNVMDLAIAVIIGAAFGKIVTSLVSDVLMPVLGILTQGINFSSLELHLGDATLKYGAFLQAVVDFLIISLCVFLLVKGLNALQKKKEEEGKPAEMSTQEKLLAEIRDLLKAKQETSGAIPAVSEALLTGMTMEKK